MHLKKVTMAVAAGAVMALSTAAPAVAAGSGSTNPASPIPVTPTTTDVSVTVNWAGMPANEMLFITQCRRDVADAEFDPFADCALASTQITVNPSSNPGSGSKAFTLFHGAEPSGDSDWGCFNTQNGGEDTVPAYITDPHETCYIRVTAGSQDNTTDDFVIPVTFQSSSVPVPEVPLPVVLPLAGLALAGGGFFLMRRRSRPAINV